MWEFTPFLRGKLQSKLSAVLLCVVLQWAPVILPAWPQRRVIVGDRLAQVQSLCQRLTLSACPVVLDTAGFYKLTLYEMSQGKLVKVSHKSSACLVCLSCSPAPALLLAARWALSNIWEMDLDQMPGAHPATVSFTVFKRAGREKNSRKTLID